MLKGAWPALRQGCRLAADDRLMHPVRQLPVRPLTEPEQHAGAQDIEQRLEGVEPRRQHGETDQRRDASAREHPVIDLKHEQRRRESQQSMT